MLLEKKVIIVTGAASPRGIGQATAKALAAQGSIYAKRMPSRPPPISAPHISASPAT